MQKKKVTGIRETTLCMRAVVKHIGVGGEVDVSVEAEPARVDD